MIRHLSEIEGENGSYPGSDHRQKHAEYVLGDVEKLIPLFLFGYANRVYAGNHNDKSRYGEDRYQCPVVTVLANAILNLLSPSDLSLIGITFLDVPFCFT